MTSSVSLVIADDHPLMVHGLRLLFESSTDFHVLAVAADGDGAIRAVRGLNPDVLLLDMDMPKLDGFGVLAELRQQSLACGVVLYTAQLEDARLLEAIQLGARGIVSKTVPPERLVQAVREVAGGGQWLEMETVARVLNKLAKSQPSLERVSEQLTARELDVVREVARGLRNKVIADRLNIRESTVRIHLVNIFRKLKLDSRGALIVFAQQNGLV